MGQTTFTKAQYEQHFATLGTSYYVVERPNIFFAGVNCLSSDNATAQIYWVTTRLKKSNDNNKDSGSDGTEQEDEDEQKTKLEHYHRAIQAVQGTVRPEFLLPLYQTTPDEMIIPPISFEDYVPPEEGFPKGRVTLIGDAAHQMTPCTLEIKIHSVEVFCFPLTRFRSY